MIVVDTGPLVALADADSRLHDACLRALRDAHPPRLVPPTVIAEVCYLLARDAGAKVEASFLRSFATDFLTASDMTEADLSRAADLVEQYEDLSLGGTDATAIALAERHGIREVVTLDIRHFHVVRPRHVDHFTLLPEST